jgi:hypothetical protein
MIHVKRSDYLRSKSQDGSMSKKISDLNTYNATAANQTDAVIDNALTGNHVDCIKLRRSTIKVVRCCHCGDTTVLIQVRV